mmetsp:Transcript_30058/g.76571  ORF Transcript_30058/g.76571 Transcript_30058/m.76571 type:complete len:226 (-) Transcript_30058:78-755(-)
MAATMPAKAMPSEASTKAPTRAGPFSTSSPTISSTGCGGTGIGHTGLPVSASWITMPVMPIIAARPLLRSAFSLNSLPAKPGLSSYRTHANGITSPGPPFGFCLKTELSKSATISTICTHARPGSAAHEAIVPPGMSENLMSSEKERYPGQRTPASVRNTCTHAAIEKRPCLISISWKRRYFSGFFVISCSGSYTPSGLVVPMSPGLMALICTDETADRATRGAW